MYTSFLVDTRLNIMGRIVIILFACQNICQGESTNTNNNNCKECGTVTSTKVITRVSCCGEGGSWHGNCGIVATKDKAHTWDEGIDVCKKAGQNKCKCGKVTNTVITGAASCCGEGGSWHRNCGTIDEHKAHTWTQGLDACGASANQHYELGKPHKANENAKPNQPVKQAEVIKLNKAKKNAKPNQQKKKINSNKYSQPKNSQNRANNANKDAELNQPEKDSNPNKHNQLKNYEKRECTQCGKLASGTSSCCGKGGSWQGNCGTVAQRKAYTWVEGVNACKGSAIQHDEPNEPTKANEGAIKLKVKKNLCTQCGKAPSGTSSCCGKGGSWQGNCGTAAQRKAHTWTEGVNACTGSAIQHAEPNRLNKAKTNAKPNQQKKKINSNKYSQPKNNQVNKDADPNQPQKDSNPNQHNQLKTYEKRECTQCGKLASGTSSCCGKDGSWHGNCGTFAQRKAYTWVEGVNACKKNQFLRGSSQVELDSKPLLASESKGPQNDPELDIDRPVSATSREEIAYITGAASLLIIAMIM